MTFQNKLLQNRAVVLLRESFKEFGAEHGDHLAASVSYNLFFSLFPLAMLGIYITRLVPQWQNIQVQMMQGIDYVLPGFGTLISDLMSNLASLQGGVGIVVLAGAVWGGLSFFNAVTLSLNVTWGIKKSMIKNQMVNFILLIAAGVLVFISIMLTVVLNGNAACDIVCLSNPVIFGAANVMTTGFAFLMFLIFYKFMPTVRPSWKDIWLGALIAAVLFEATKIVFMLWLRFFNPFNSMGRSISGAVGLMMWAYMSALVFLFVAKVTYVNLKGKKSFGVVGISD